ncbi:putative glycosyltransferase [Roseibacterium elongatum DSM 19469]|uniref:Putative glycosyltransferase n=1 Tax=Roseicyclus elongatus DSM 19469 TaxID=1294273 RepID=W8SQ12_9RHOB|nr:sugar transferase [Roseibacterium elongatum]AHM04630.1 putative glycosyltransferase [Roseibacterium elongatum DSM 19469]
MTLVPDVSGFTESRSRTLRARTSDAVFRISKRAFDLVFSTIVLLPAMVVVGLALLILNPIFNPGPLFFRQIRMGRNCRPFWAYKFRTMRQAAPGTARCRPLNAPLEVDRITKIGGFLRRSRFDELPQILNVYRGEMSLIGPRPDYFIHAHRYIRAIPEYRARHAVRPGISGLAQIEVGYAQGLEATRLKTAADMDYIRSAGLRLDTWILWQTIRAVIDMRGE